jgi:hypothetical protein
MTSHETNLGISELIRSLYPDASNEDLSDAQQSLTEYVAASLRIFDRIQHDRDSRGGADCSTIQLAKSNDV